MGTLLEQFQDIIRGIDANLGVPVDPEALVTELSAIIPSDHQLSLEEKAEELGFSFADRFTRSDDGYYFGPRISIVQEDGSGFESPFLKEVQTEMIDYWTNRSTQVQHPFLVTRYAGLGWSLAALFPERKTDPQLRKRFIQASIDLVAGELVPDGAVLVRWLDRALEVSAKYNDQEFLVPIKELILHQERHFESLEKPGPWGFAYDSLLASKRIRLTEAEEQEVIERLERKLRLFSQPNIDGKTDPSATEYAASRLAEHYTKRNRPKDVRRVVLAVGQAYEPLLASSTSLQVSGWMQKLHQLYLYHRLNAEADEMLRRLRQVSALAAEEMGGFEHKFELPKDKTDEFVVSFFQGDAEEALEQIVARFIPDKAEARQSLYDLARHAPMQFAFPIQLTDQKGRVIANIGALDKDEDGQLLLRISEQLHFQAFFLHLVLQNGLDQEVLDKQVILEFLSKSAVIYPDRLPILDRAFMYYFDQDYLGFVHVAIPQVEEAVRNLVEHNCGKILRYKDGKYQLKTFDDVLRDEAFLVLCGENIQLYFRILFTDPIGWNLRNDVCHGLLGYELFTKQAADRVLHALLTLGMIRLAAPVASTESTTTS